MLTNDAPSKKVKKKKRKHCTIFIKMYSILDISEYLDNFNSNYIYMLQMLKFSKIMFFKEQICIKENEEFFGFFYKKIQNRIFKINWLFNRHVLKLFLWCAGHNLIMASNIVKGFGLKTKICFICCTCLIITNVMDDIQQHQHTL
jgi:hypothetical protein